MVAPEALHSANVGAGFKPALPRPIVQSSRRCAPSNVPAPCAVFASRGKREIRTIETGEAIQCRKP
ncbi:MAG: hypothetical protein LBM98_09190 [Oscillospiraceae bacterium]|nr:hypothetical protein [Oscillospiraceae bacterium]